MTFHIDDALVIERAIFVAVAIIVLGIASIGSLWLWRVLSEKAQRDSRSDVERRRELAIAVEQLNAALKEQPSTLDSIPPSPESKVLQRDIDRLLIDLRKASDAAKQSA